MSDQENETSKDEATSTKDRPGKSKANPFLSALRNNQVAQAKEALMKTVCERPENTMGSILEALENDSDGEYIMLDIFKSLTIEELVQAAAPHVLPGWGALRMESVVIPLADDDDLDDDDEFEDDGTLEDDDDTPDPPKAPKRKSPSKKVPSKKKSKAAQSNKAPPKSAPKPSGVEDIAHQKAILKCLSENKAKNAESAMSGPAIRDVVGGNDVEFRAAMGAIREKGRADVTGKARGTKYFRIPKKKA